MGVGDKGTDMQQWSVDLFNKIPGLSSLRDLKIKESFFQVESVTGHWFLPPLFHLEHTHGQECMSSSNTKGSGKL